MSDSDYKIGVKFEADTKDFIKDVEEAEQATEEFGDELDKHPKQDMPNYEKGLVGLAAKLKLAETAWNVFSTGLETGISYNVEIEKYTTSFETMTGSAEKASEVLEKLKEKAAATPFELPHLAEMTQLLMNYGLEAEDAIEKMNMLGDISQGNAEKMKSIATAYGQMSSAGKVSLEDVKQMIEAGFNPLLEISQSTGESMESLYSRISNGTLAINEITASMERSTSEGGKYFQAMDQQSQTLDGRLSTLQDTVANKLGGAVQGFTDYLRDNAIPGLTSFIDGLDAEKVTYFGIVVGTLTALVVAYHVQQSLATSGLTLWQVVSGTATAATTALGAAFTFLTSPIGLTILAIGAVIAIGVALATHWEEISALGKEIFIGLYQFVDSTFLSKWRAGWNAVTTTFGNIFGGIGNIAKKPINGLIGLVNSAISRLNRISVSIPDWVPIFGGSYFGINLPKIPYLLHGTDNWQGGFAYMNEGGRGELVNLPNGTQVIPHDISIQYAKETARLNQTCEPLDISDIFEYMTINVYTTNVMDGTELKTVVSDYTIERINEEARDYARAQGGYVYG